MQKQCARCDVGKNADNIIYAVSTVVHARRIGWRVRIALFLGFESISNACLLFMSCSNPVWYQICARLSKSAVILHPSIQSQKYPVPSSPSNCRDEFQDPLLSS